MSATVSQSQTQSPSASATAPEQDQHVTDLIDRYIAMWNETDGAARRDLIARTWTEDASYLDPLMAGDGRSGIDAMVAGFQQQFAGVRFRRTSEVDAHHGRVRFGWDLAPVDGPPLAGGVDFGVVVDGRLKAIVGFLDFAPAGVGG